MVMTPEQVAYAYFDYWNAGDFTGLTSLFADDMIWVIKGFSPESAEFTQDQIAGLLLRLPELPTAEPFRLHLQTVTANDERAAAEFTSTLKFHDGREYKNEYHFLLFVEKGKIVRGHEYLCTWTAVHQGIGDDLAKLLRPA